MASPQPGAEEGTTSTAGASCAQDNLLNLPQLPTETTSRPAGSGQPAEPSPAARTGPSAGVSPVVVRHERSFTLAEDSEIELDVDSLQSSLDTPNGGDGVLMLQTPRTPAAESSASQHNNGTSTVSPTVSPSVRRAGLQGGGDPDYEIPEGTLTETQVLMSVGHPINLDRFGFVVVVQEAASTSRPGTPPLKGKHRERELRHIQKWRKMLGPNGSNLQAYMERKFVKLKRRIRKGIPEQFRGLAWHVLSGGRDLMAEHPGEFQRLQANVNADTEASIMRDLNRTFPNHIFFMQRQGPGQRSLYTVLRAYSAYDSRVGYVQGMGFLTAVLLLYMSDEEAFWTLVAIMKGREIGDKLEGLYLSGLPLLRCCMFQFQHLAKATMPRLAAHLEAEGVEPALFATHWFNTVFAYSLPFEHLLRVWDVFMLEGLKVVFRVGLTILSHAEDKLINAPFEVIVEQLNAKNLYALVPPRPSDLLRKALRISVSKDLARLRAQWVQEHGDF